MAPTTVVLLLLQMYGDEPWDSRRECPLLYCCIVPESGRLLPRPPLACTPVAKVNLAGFDKSWKNTSRAALLLLYNNVFVGRS